MRHYRIDTQDVDDVQEGKDFLEHGEDYGELSTIGVYDESTNTFYCEEKSFLIGVNNEERLNIRLESLASINIIPTTIIKY